MDANCKLNRESCPPGHEMVACEVKKFSTCVECDPTKNFQPNVNRGDKCRLKRVCDKPFMDYKSGGSKTADAECMCEPGFHFENEDQRACVPNSVCQIGYGQGKYGNCEPCVSRNMFSNKTDRFQPCLPTTNCESLGRCIVKKSNGSYDNECSPPLKDISRCSNLTSAELLKLLKGEEGTSTAVIVGAVLGSIAALILIACVITLVVLVINSRRRRKKCDCHVTSVDQFDELKRRVIEKCEKDPAFCNKTIDTSFRDIEDNINRQIWSFAQELFRTHYQSGKYEAVVEKYKNLHRKVAVHNYLQEWKMWRGCDADSVRILFDSLKTCGRPEIIYETCNKLSSNIEGAHELEICKSAAHNRALKPSIKDELCDILFPCGKQKERTKGQANTETTKTLLGGQQSCDVEVGSSDSTLRTCPSAPNFSSQGGNEFGQYHVNRQYSVPVQVTE